MKDPNPSVAERQTRDSLFLSAGFLIVAGIVFLFFGRAIGLCEIILGANLSISTLWAFSKKGRAMDVDLDAMEDLPAAINAMLVSTPLRRAVLGMLLLSMLVSLIAVVVLWALSKLHP